MYIQLPTLLSIFILFNTRNNITDLYTHTHKIFLKKCQVDFGMILLLFGKGVFSISRSTGFLFLLQLPLTGPLQKELMTRNAWVFLQNSCTFGLSCVPPRCL